MTMALAPANAAGLPASDATDQTLLRTRTVDLIHRLIDLLDAIDGDADLELSAPVDWVLGFHPTSDQTDDDENGWDFEDDRLAMTGGASC